MLKSAYSRIARQSGLSSTPLVSRTISQETVRKWKKAAKESSSISNQALAKEDEKKERSVL